MAASDPRQNLDLVRAVERIAAARRVAAFTGAGVSAESGVPTFRGGEGLWENHPLEEVASIQGWRRDPLRVWRFYEGRRGDLRRIRPNAGHYALAELERRIPEFSLITQNVDGLHILAGSQRVTPLHGDLWRVRCVRCNYAAEDRTHPLPELPPACPVCAAHLRPDIVWFGEAVPLYAEAERLASGADLLLVIGTSGHVYPAAGLVQAGLEAGAFMLEINPEQTALSRYAHLHLRGPSGEILPRLLEQLESLEGQGR